MMTPKPTDRLKKIWPAAASHVCALPSVGEVRVPHEAEAVDHVLVRPRRIGRAQGEHAARGRSWRSTAMTGMAQDTNFSIPFEMPR